jgi:hypothetical protein
MLENYYGVVEMGFVFGLIVVFCLWQLYSIEKTRERLRRAPPSGQPRAQKDGSAPD